MKATTKATINFMYFGHNYPYNFIFEVWGGSPLSEEPSLAKHLQDKFSVMYERYGTMTFFRWFMELDGRNKEILVEWIDQNYKG